MNENILNLGAVAVIFLFAIKEYFSWQKSRKENGGKSNEVMGAMLKELRTMNENHLVHLKDSINEGNNRIIDAINNGNIKQIEILSEIKGSLKK